MENDEVLLTMKEAMARLRISRSTLYRLMWAGRLTGYKVSSTWRFKPDDVQNCIKWTPAQPPDILLDAV